YGEIILPTRIVDRGEKMTVKLKSFEGKNAALVVTHNCFSETAIPEPTKIELHREGDIYAGEVEIEFNEPGNTKIEFWCGSGRQTRTSPDGTSSYEIWDDVGRITRQVAVLDGGYSAVIPWIGCNVPTVGEEIHRFDLPGDFWFPIDLSDDWENRDIGSIAKIVRGAHLYGDRPAVIFDAKTLVPGRKQESVFELDHETQKNGIEKLIELVKQTGIEPELFACYTPDCKTIEILEKNGIRGLTSLCVWQNWQDNGADGWKINHSGAPNQPFYPSDDDFRKNGKQRNIMCFSMGNASCNRNYSVMAYDGCPSNASVRQRYRENRAEHFHIQRFYDAFDGFIAAAKHSNELLSVTLAIEAFRGFADWNAVNETAVRYVVKKASREKIVFCSAADIAEYHIRKNMDMQRAYFFQFDNYFGEVCGNMTGHAADRIEADTPEYLAVIKRGSLRPMFFFDYTVKWENGLFKNAGRDRFGLVNPDTHDPSEWDPAQVESRDVEFDSFWDGDTLTVSANSGTPKKRMVTGVFDVPFAKDFEFSVDKPDAEAVKIFDTRGDNVHLFIDMGALGAGENELRITFKGKRRTPDKYVYTFGGLEVMLFGDHAYLRSLDNEEGIEVKMDAPDGAYLFFPDGKKSYAKDGKLEFTLNTDWSDECPVLYGFDRALFEKAKIETKNLGPTGIARRR
ncbi:MAG: hypothetical protein IJV00_09365, partial [Clostridia bacterium]|nr:hypothetical protein [Clostridia bacterium]